MSSRTSCQKSDKIRQKSAPMSLGSSCQKSDKDQPPCPLGLVVKNQTLKVKAVWRCQQRGILLKSPQQGIFLVSKYIATCLIIKVQKRRNAEFYNTATKVNRGSRCQHLVASFFTTTRLMALTKVVCFYNFSYSWKNKSKAIISDIPKIGWGCIKGVWPLPRLFVWPLEHLW